jgi:hypothetical protein
LFFIGKKYLTEQEGEKEKMNKEMEEKQAQFLMQPTEKS